MGWIVSPQNVFVEFLTANMLETGLIWKLGHCRRNYWGWGHAGRGWPLIKCDVHPYERRKFWHRHTGTMPCEDEDWELGDASAGQGTPKMTSKPPEAEERPGIPPPQSPRRNQPAHTWVLGFQPPDLRDNTFLLIAPPACGTLLHSPHRLMQPLKNISYFSPSLSAWFYP